MKTSETVLHSKTYQYWYPCCRLSACPLSASPCWCHRPQPWIPGACPHPLWSSWWKCPATMESAWHALPAASVALAENEGTPGNGKQCHLQGGSITGKTEVWHQGGDGGSSVWCFTQVHMNRFIPVPPATSRSCEPGCGCMMCSNLSFHSRWIPRLIASFITSYFWATFSNTLYTERAKMDREHPCLYALFEHKVFCT